LQVVRIINAYSALMAERVGFRAEGRAALAEKLLTNLLTRFPEKRVQKLLEIYQDQEKLASMAVPDFVGLFIG
jgi:2-methylcitrate dehydratase